jgi:hypothetical protein
VTSAVLDHDFSPRGFVTARDTLAGRQEVLSSGEKPADQLVGFLARLAGRRSTGHTVGGSKNFLKTGQRAGFGGTMACMSPYGGAYLTDLTDAEFACLDPLLRPLRMSAVPGFIRCERS